MEFKDAFGTDVAPGDKIKYWSPTYKQWRHATIVQFLWNTKGWSIKIKPSLDTGVVLKGNWQEKIQKLA